jgi:predicted peroxiredoxin
MSSGTLLRCAIFSALSILIVTAQVAHAEDKTPRDGVFLHVSHGVDKPHRVLMALNMAEIMAENRDVLVYFDIKGIEVVLGDAPNLTFSHFPASKTQIQKLIGMGIGVYACPGCLKAAGKAPADLMPGVKVADKDAFFSFTEGRILTLDY